MRKADPRARATYLQGDDPQRSLLAIDRGAWPLYGTDVHTFHGVTPQHRYLRRAGVGFGHPTPDS
jgi:hypothetical protein